MQAKKPDFKIFAGGAEDGELHDFPDVTRGWGVTKLQTNKKPPLSWMNGAFNRVDNNFYYLLQNGLVEWNSEIEYSANALTQQNGVIYRAKEASKGDNPSASAKWEKLFADKVGTSDYVGMSQSAIKKELDKKINSSDLTQTITSDKLKAPSNFAVGTALKEQDPRQWGFGGAQTSAIQLYSSHDLNNITACGEYRWSTAPANSPASYAWMKQTSWGEGYQQVVISSDGPAFIRAKENTSTPWRAWQGFVTSGNTSIDPNGVLTTKQDTVTLTTNDLAKETGNSHSKVMSQKAVTNELFGRLLNVQVFTSSGIYTPTPGTKKILIEVQGAGGSGANTGFTADGEASIASGGSAGGYACSFLSIDQAINQIITVGAGGAINNGLPAEGNPGGTSSFGNLIICEGGPGGHGQARATPPFSCTGTVGGTATGGNIFNKSGDASTGGIAVSSNAILCGNGGSSKFGTGGFTPTNINTNGRAAIGYGAGGGGTISQSNPNAGNTGGAGMGGVIVIWEYA